jgi:hypothetical protein
LKNLNASHFGLAPSHLHVIVIVIVIDLLLKALHAVQKQFPFYLRYRGSQLVEQDPVCYADDLQGLASCREDTIEAFAAMFGIRFALKKLRAITTSPIPGVMILYHWDWNEIYHVSWSHLQYELLMVEPI